VSIPKRKNYDSVLSYPDFTLCPMSAGVWFCSHSPGRSQPWTERLWSHPCFVSLCFQKKICSCHVSQKIIKHMSYSH